MVVKISGHFNISLLFVVYYFLWIL